jgi:hypothetical protein
METNWTRWVIPLIIGVVLVLVFIFWAWGQIQNLPIGYEVNSEKTRLLRYLTCSYAMCAQPCNDPKVMALPLEIESGVTKLGCYDKCKELANLKGKSESEHLCGNDYKLELTLNSPVTYRGDYHVCVFPCLSDSYNRLETDAYKYNWGSKVLDHNEYCFSKKNEKITLGGYNYDRGCVHAIVPPDNIGLCEGVLMKSGSCEWSDKSDALFDKDKAVQNCALNTGHIWIGPDLESQCFPFENNKYLANCTFDEGQTIYIWTGEDTEDVAVLGKFYCPELILCSNPTP